MPSTARSLHRRYGHARMTKALRAQIVEDVALAARQNARETEGVSYLMSDDGRSREYGPEIQEAYARSVRSIGDSLQSEHEYRSYSPRQLTYVEAQSIVNELLKRGY